MAIILFDDAFRDRLYPFTQTRAVADLRMGIVSIRERWQLKSGQEVYVHTEKYLQSRYPDFIAGDHICVNASVMVDDDIFSRIMSLQLGESLVDKQGLIAGRTDVLFTDNNITTAFTKSTTVEAKRLQHSWQLFQWNDKMMREDFVLLTKNRKSQPISSTNKITHAENIFVEEGAIVEHSFLNASEGPVYIGKNVLLMEGSMIRGPFAACEGSVVKMGTRIYGATTLGPHCTAGGEIKNSIMMGYNNKGHDGYLGDSVIGEWCNLGAGTTNSNIKNTAGSVKVWDQYTKTFMEAGQKCGVLMGDYSKTAINSSINTGSVIGVCANVFGNGLLPKYIKDFSWGIEGTYEFDKALRDIENWKKLKHQKLSSIEIEVLKYLFGA